MALQRSGSMAASSFTADPEDSTSLGIQSQESKHAHDIEDLGFDYRWHPVRQFMGKVFHSKSFDATLGMCILTNMALLVIETDREAAQEEVPGWVTTINTSLMIVYIIELTSRLYVFRMAWTQEFGNWADACQALVEEPTWNEAAPI